MTRRDLQTSRCPRCRATTSEGLDADLFAQAIHIDPQPITTTAELLAIAAGRTTYDIIGNQLEPREPAHINPRRRYPVVAQHTCDTPPLPVDPQPAKPATADQPPF